MICITGPESCGKTTLSGQLAKEFDFPLVSEIARDYLSNLKIPYAFEDVEKMAKLQLEAQLRFGPRAVFIADTDLLTFKIWAEVKFKRSISLVDEYLKNCPIGIYLLCYPDTPWVEDPFRENPNDRLELFNLYKATLEEHKLNYFTVKGLHKDRFNNASKILKKSLSE